MTECYKTKKGYYYKKTQDGGSKRVSKEEYNKLNNRVTKVEKSVKDIYQKRAVRGKRIEKIEKRLKNLEKKM